MASASAGCYVVFRLLAARALDDGKADGHDAPEEHQFKASIQYVSLDIQRFDCQNIVSECKFPTEYEKFPKEAAVYLMDKMEFSDLVVNVGGRVDYANSGGDFWTDPLDPLGEQDLTDDDLEYSKNSLNSVKAVPNPYFVRNIWESSYDSRRLQFINLPNSATLRIFTVNGDLVKTIVHNLENLITGKGGTAEWNLISDHGIKVASGMYYFDVEWEAGSQIGKFAIIL